MIIIKIENGTRMSTDETDYRGFKEQNIAREKETERTEGNILINIERTLIRTEGL